MPGAVLVSERLTLGQDLKESRMQFWILVMFKKEGRLDSLQVGGLCKVRLGAKPPQPDRTVRLQLE